MSDFDIEAVRAEVRAMDFVRGTPAEIAMWREDDEDSRANLAIEDMALEPNDAALFDMFRDEAVPPPLATQILLRLLGHPDADRTLPIARCRLRRSARSADRWAVHRRASADKLAARGSHGCPALKAAIVLSWNRRKQGSGELTDALDQPAV